eukprot:TRINITY_DN25071_c0_g1_i1.p1 TRINITY_DN25071_c0_g1~~TRINITY_DN25071_c0_g1_i1.p1  ORF type:complete len:311 (-),score=31.28 TRINITY_DN25071_c0_g1_i1:64-996(-)
MATTFSISFPLDTQPHTFLKPHHPSLTKLISFSFTNKPSHSLNLLKKFDRYNSTNQTPPLSTPPSSTSYSNLTDPPRTGRFLAPGELEKLEFLQNFEFLHKFDHGSLRIRMMGMDEVDATVAVLAESFAESMGLPMQSMGLPMRYVSLLGFLVKQYMLERQEVMPHAVTLVGFYREEGGDEVLAGTVEISFDAKGANAAPPTPLPPKGCPYICNMTVKKGLRRKGIGRHLLMASEDLILQMGASRDVYLHCRKIDIAPLNMYKNAGYCVVKTDNYLTWLKLQRRKHLMCKKLSVLNNLSLGKSGSDGQPI